MSMSGNEYNDWASTWFFQRYDEANKSITIVSYGLLQ